MANLDLGPLKLGEILDRMFLIYRKNFLLLFITSSLPYLCLLPIALIVILSGSFPNFNSQQPPSPAAIVAIFTIILTIFFCFAFFGVASWVATTAAVWQIQMGGKPTIRGVYRVALHRFGTSLLAAIVVGAALFAGYMFFVIPAIFVALEFCLTMEAVVCEGASAMEAIGRSRKLVSGYRGRVFVAWLVCSIVSAAVGYVLILPPLVAMAVMGQSGTFAGWLFALLAIAYFFALTLPAPLLAIALCLIYYDARVRKEGFDLQRLLDELPPAAPASGPAPRIAIS